MSKMTEAEWHLHQKRKKEIESQNIKDDKFLTRPMGKAPVSTLTEPAKIKRSEIVEKAKLHAVNIWTRPSHKRNSYD